MSGKVAEYCTIEIQTACLINPKTFMIIASSAEEIGFIGVSIIIFP